LLTGSGYFARFGLFREQMSAPFVQHDIRQLTTNGKVDTSALSPDGKLFAYSVNDMGQKSLWLGHVDGGNHLQLRPTAPDADYFDLAFAPDSTHLYFSYKTDRSAAALYKIPVSGGAPEKVLDGIGSFSLSADGSLIAYGQGVGESDVIVISDTQGANRREIASFPKTRSFLFDSISWSPDGTRLAISKAKDDRPLRSDLALVTVADGAIQTIKDDTWREILETAWLKDGSGVIVSAIKGNAWASVPKYQLFHVDISSGRSQEITRDLSSYVSLLGLTADGDAIMTIEHRQLNNIWIAPANDLAAARQITFGAFGKYDGHWGMDLTPNGKIIYTNSDTESSFISEMDIDGSGCRPLT
jgi:Tol biopolymer transport system component